MYRVRRNYGVFWYKDPEHTIQHRIGGPAAIFDSGEKVWLVNNKRHREDGPALIWLEIQRVAWYLDGKLYEFEEYFEELSKTKSLKEIMLLRLKYG